MLIIATSWITSLRFHKYPRNINDLSKLSIIPFSSRIRLLSKLLPLAFSNLQKAEKWDQITLTELTENLYMYTKSLVDAICMLAFVGSPENISLGESARIIICANPFKGGTSEFGLGVVQIS